MDMGIHAVDTRTINIVADAMRTKQTDVVGSCTLSSDGVLQAELLYLLVLSVFSISENPPRRFWRDIDAALRVVFSLWPVCWVPDFEGLVLLLLPREIGDDVCVQTVRYLERSWRLFSDGVSLPVRDFRLDREEMRRAICETRKLLVVGDVTNSVTSRVRCDCARDMRDFDRMLGLSS